MVFLGVAGRPEGSEVFGKRAICVLTQVRAFVNVLSFLRGRRLRWYEAVDDLGGTPANQEED